MSPVPPIQDPRPGPGSAPESGAPAAGPAPADPGAAPGTPEPRGRTVARRASVVAGAFLVLLAGAMVAGEWRQPREEPWRSRELNAARERLATDPKNEALKTEIRNLDRDLRRAYFLGLERNRRGAWMLLGAGVVLVVISRGWGQTHRARSTESAADLPREARISRTRLAVAGLGLAGMGAMTAAGLLSPSRLPEELARTLAAASATGSALAPAPASATGREDGASAASAPAAPGGAGDPSGQWPRFLGPAGRNWSAEAGLPERWDAASGQGVLWKTAVPLTGFNSPVAWGARVFLTGGDKKARLVFCFDLGTGALLWQRPVTPAEAPAAAVEPPDQSGAAASSAATDGERVYAVFASGELGALDFEGRLVWHRKLDFSENGYGHASSLVVWQDRLLVQADQGREEDGKSTLEALDARTGKPVWTARRPVGGSWATPLVADVGGKALVITAGDPWLMAHDAASGAERWRAKVLGGELAPSPVWADGLVLAVSPGHAMVALKPDGSGEVTESHVAWKLEADLPDVPTPAADDDGLFYTASTEGHVFCRETATGKPVWDHRFEAEIQASPLLVSGRIYLFTQPGGVFVLQAGREFRQVAAFEMGEEIYASPAVAGGRLLVRAKSNLYCLGTAGTAAGAVAAVRASPDHGR